MILLKAMVGSNAYNLNITSSDTDYRGVYLEDLGQLFGLKSTGSTHFDGLPDDTIYPLQQFVKLLAKGNPNILEILWLKDEFYEHIDPLFRTFFVDHREKCLSKNVTKAYLGYARGQIGLVHKNGRPEHSKNGYDAKAAMHVFRLLYQLRNLLEHGDPQVFVNYETRKFLLRIRSGSMFGLFEEFEKEANKWFEELDSLSESSYLVDAVDYEWVNKMLIEFYRYKHFLERKE